MSARAAALIAFAFLEVLAGVVLRSETLAARARAEAQLRREESCLRRAAEYGALYQWLSAPEQRIERERQSERVRRAAAEDPNRDL